MDTVTCPLCRKEVTRPGFGKHVCSKAHHVELRTELRKMGAWDKSYCLKDDSNKLPTFKKGNQDYSVCFGCQKVYVRADNSEHLKTCKKKAEHKAALREILGGDEGVEVPAGDAPVDAAAEEAIRQLRAKVALLEKQVVEQQKTIKGLNDTIGDKKEDIKELKRAYRKQGIKLSKANRLFYTAVGCKKPGMRGPSYGYSKYFLRMNERAGTFRPLCEFLTLPMEDEDYDIDGETTEEEDEEEPTESDDEA